MSPVALQDFSKEKHILLVPENQQRFFGFPAKVALPEFFGVLGQSHYYYYYYNLA